LGGNISEYGVGRLAWRLDHVALDAGDETVDRTSRWSALDAGADMIMIESENR
jgi:hypothetical protein